VLWRALIALALGFGVLAPAAIGAHEVPARVVVRTFVHTDGQQVRVLVRVPLNAMRDVEFPLRGAAGYLDLAAADSTLRDAAQLWVADAITMTANGATMPLERMAALRASLPSDGAFDAYSTALASTTGAPLDPSTDIVAGQVMLDVLLEYRQPAPNARLAIQSRFGHLGLKTTNVVRFVPAGGAERAFLYEGDQRELQLEPGWIHAAGRFVGVGTTHLLEGIDHILFLLCLVIPVRRVRPLIGIVTAFTVAHSITLGASVLGYAPRALWFPPVVELLIAASIVYMAIENMVGANVGRRWKIAFGFGLIHGFGFSYALQDSLQFAGGHLATALAAFNIGIELGQLALLVVAVPVFSWIFTRVLPERIGVLIVSVMVAHTAWHWMTERFETVRAYDFVAPAWDVALALTAVRTVSILFVAGVAAWGLDGLMTRWSSVQREQPVTSSPAAVTPPTPRSIALLWLCLGVATLGLSPETARAQTATAAPARSTMSGVYTDDQAAKGREVFAGNCSGCHTVGSHSGTAFSARWMGRPLAEFYNYVSQLMPKSGPGTLTEDEYVWVTAYVLKLNSMPAGGRELTADPVLLKTIRIDSTVLKGKGPKQSDVSPTAMAPFRAHPFHEARTEKP
jgi:mono/diheme cytochrome c family protein